MKLANDGLVYVCDRENSRVQIFTGDGQFVSMWTDIHRPTDIAMDREGTFYVSELEHAMCRLLAEVDLVDPERRIRAEQGSNLLDVVTPLRNDRQRVRERVREQLADLLGMLRPHVREGLLLRDEVDAPHERARRGESGDGVHLRRGRLLRARVGRAVVHVHDELLLHVVAPRDDPGAERDEQAEQEHSDQDGDGRGEGRRDVGAKRSQRLRDDELEPFHYDS